MFKHKHTPSLLLLTSITLVTWHKVLNQTFLGEGYHYFSPHLNFIPLENGKPIIQLWRYNNFARLYFDIFPFFFRDQIILYLVAQLVIMITLSFTVYFIVYNLSQEKTLAITSSILFITSFIGSFEMFAIGNYQRFAERIPVLIPMLFSFYFLYQYFSQKKIKHYLFSITIFSLSIFLSHFSILLIPSHLSLIFLSSFKKPLSKNLFKGLIVAFSFILVGLIITYKSEHPPKQSPIEFIRTQEKLTQKLALHLPAITLPHNSIAYLAKRTKDPYPFTTTLSNLLLPTILIYTIGTLFVFIRQRKLFLLYLISLFSTIGIITVYFYEDPRFDIFKNFGQSRFYFLPSIFLAITWAIILRSVFKSKKYFYILSILFLSSYLYYNFNLINRNITLIQYKSTALKSTTAYIKNISPNFKQNSIIVMPSSLRWISPMATLYYLPEGAKIVLPTTNWQEKYRFAKENIFVIDYDYQNEPNTLYNSKKGFVLDHTSAYRQGKNIVFKSQ